MQQDGKSEQRRQAVRIPLRTVTPLFLAGADPRGRAELRAPSVRGALRFWLRALAGGCYGTDDAGLQRVRDLEAEVFGDAGGEKGHGASKVVVSIDAPDGLLPRDPRAFLQRAGIRYLFWSMQDAPKERCYAPNVGFNLLLAPRHRRTDQEKLEERDKHLSDSEAMEFALYSAWLLLTLGGLGARQRRMAGSISSTVSAVDGWPGYKLSLPSDPHQASSLVGQYITRFRCRISNEYNAVFDESILPPFEIIHPYYCRIWILGAWNSWAAAADEIGTELRNYRMTDPRSGTKRSVHDRWIFGLPLQGVSAKYQTNGREDEVKRRFSPLWLRLSRSQDGKILGVATVFKARPLPPGTVIHPVNRTAGSRPPVFRVIEDFIRRFPNAVEVRYE